MKIEDTEEGYVAHVEGGTIRGQDRAMVELAAAQYEHDLERRERLETLWGHDSRTRIVRLACTFPSLRSAAGLDSWDPTELLRWALEQSMGARYAALFVLSVWNYHTDWAEVAVDEGLVDDPDLRTFAFHTVRAFATWDDAHRAAFLAWCNAPFFP